MFDGQDFPAILGHYRLAISPIPPKTLKPSLRPICSGSIPEPPNGMPSLRNPNIQHISGLMIWVYTMCMLNVFKKCLISEIYIYCIYIYNVQSVFAYVCKWDMLLDHSLWNILTTCHPPKICSEAQSFHGGHALGWRRVTGQQGRLPRDHAQQAPQGAGEVASTTYGLRMKVQYTHPHKKRQEMVIF